MLLKKLGSSMMLVYVCVRWNVVDGLWNSGHLDRLV